MRRHSSSVWFPSPEGQTPPPIPGTGSYPAEFSPDCRHGQFVFTGAPRSIRKSGGNIGRLKIGIKTQNFILPCPGGNQAENGAHSDAHPTNARFSTHDGGIKGNTLELWKGHDCTVPLLPEQVQRPFQDPKPPRPLLWCGFSKPLWGALAGEVAAATNREVGKILSQSSRRSQRSRASGRLPERFRPLLPFALNPGCEEAGGGDAALSKVEPYGPLTPSPTARAAA